MNSNHVIYSLPSTAVEIMKPLPSQAYLKECLRYCHLSGRAYWKPRPREHFPTTRSWANWNARFPGKLAGNIHTKGYTRICIGLSGYYLHRLIFKLVCNEEPEAVDHKNLDTSDNRLSNLRPANRSLNQANQRVRRHNQIGLKGVGRNRKGFSATIRHQGTRYHLGTFATPEEAHRAYNDAAVRLFGEFAYQSPIAA